MKTGFALLAAPLFALTLSMTPASSVATHASGSIQRADIVTDILKVILPGMVYRG